MNFPGAFRTACFVVILVSVAFADDSSSTVYQKGSLKKNVAPHPTSYDLKAGDKTYQISNCADFQDAQTVDFRVKDDKIYIAHEGGKEYKCSIESVSGAAESGSIATPSTYLKGTIEGYETRRDTRVSGGGANNSVSQWTRKAKVYELRGTDLIYKVDYCGAFQAGQFSPGQEIEYRVDGDRLYIRHDNNKEYSCQIEGRRAPDNLKPTEDNKPASPPASPSSSPQSVDPSLFVFGRIRYGVCVETACRTPKGRGIPAFLM